MLRKILFVVWILIALATSMAGLEYYLTPFQEGPFLEGHALFASSGIVGHAYGILGSGFMVFGVLLYTVRKRVSVLGNLGKLKHWLQVHIFFCTMGPFLILLHSAFKVGGIVAIAFWSMALVVGSGIFGRYLYVRIPKTLQGSFLSLDALEKRRTEALSALQNRGSLDGLALADESHRNSPEKPRGLFHALWLGLRWDLANRKRLKETPSLRIKDGGSRTVSQEIAVLAMEQDRLLRQIVLLEPFQRLFRYWHVFHLPLATVMFLILAVHVTVAILFGYAWVL